MAEAGVEKMGIPVSVITVSYNSADTISDTIQSIRDQTYPSLEYIVIDGGSTDGTIDIIKENDAVINEWVSEPDNGIYDAMNKGIRRSQGEIIGILNSDDWYEPEAVETAVRTFKKHDDVDLVHGSMNVWTEKGDLHARYGAKSSMSPDLVSPFHHPTCFVRRSVYEDLGVFALDLSTAADYDFMLRFLESERKDMYVDRVLSNFRHGGVTSQQTYSPYGQLWKILRRNERGWFASCNALLFRGVRDSTVYIINLCSLHGIRKFIRRFAPYHK